MTYSDILKEMKHHGMDDFCIERYEVEAVARNKYLIHIVFDSEKKKMYLTARATDIIGSHPFESFSAFGGYDNIMNAYKVAIKEKYHLYSHGDAMLII